MKEGGRGNSELRRFYAESGICGGGEFWKWKEHPVRATPQKPGRVLNPN
jgi:hypothetical protein